MDKKVFVSCERTDIIQITDVTFYYNSFSVLTNDNLKNMGRFRIQLLLEDNTWSTQYTIAKNTQYNKNPTNWTLINLDFTIENYDFKLILHQIDTAQSEMCFSKISITHSVYQMDQVNYFKDLFESISDYRKIVLLMFLNQIAKNLLGEIGFSERDINRLSLEFKNIFIEQHEKILTLY